MKAIGVQQPFAWLIRNHFKSIETRFWNTSYRGDVLICSTKTFWGKSKRTAIATLEKISSLYNIQIDNINNIFEDLGTAQCVATIIDCHPFNFKTDFKKSLADGSEKEDDKCYSLVLKDVKQVVRKHIKCGRKWFNIDDEEIEYE